MRNSRKIYKNQRYRDGKQRIVILTDDDIVVACNKPYGTSKDNEFKKF